MTIPMTDLVKHIAVITDALIDQLKTLTFSAFGHPHLQSAGICPGWVRSIYCAFWKRHQKNDMGWNESRAVWHGSDRRSLW